MPESPQYPRARKPRKTRQPRTRRPPLKAPAPVPVPVPVPVPEPVPLARAIRQPCDPGIHTAWDLGCPACEAWSHGQVLLMDGTTVAKQLWVMAHEYPG